MVPEDGCLNVIDGLDETAESVTGFTREGLTTSTNFWTKVGHSSWENRPRHGLRRRDTINPARRNTSFAASELAVPEWMAQRPMGSGCTACRG